MKFLLLLLLLFSFLKNQDNNKILELNDNNFDEFINKTEYALVLFYPSKKVLKDYSKYVIKLNNYINNENPKNKFKIAKYDCDTYNNVTNKYSISCNLRLYYYINGTKYFYPYNYNFKKLKLFTDIKSKGSIIEIKNSSEIEEYKKLSRVILLSTFDQNSKENLLFNSLIKKYEEIFIFLYCNSNECLQTFPSNIYMLKTFDEPQITFDKTKEISIKSLEEFITVYSIELAGKLNIKSFNIMLSTNQTSLFYLRSSKNKNFVKFDKELKEIAKNYRNKMYFFYINVDKNSTIVNEIMNIFVLDKYDFPLILIFDAHAITGKITNFNMKNSINKENVEKFIEDFYAGKLEREPDSEPIPQVKSALKIVVGKTYKSELEKKRNILFLYVKENCNECLVAINIFIEFAKKYTKKLKDKRIVFKLINLSYNEVFGFKYDKFPVILLYEINNKQNPKLYTGELNNIEIEKWFANELKWKFIPVLQKKIEDL
jgi:hypothetical protein